MDVMGIIGNWGLPVLFVKLMPLLGEDPGAFSTIFNVIMFGYYLLSNYVIRFSKKKKNSNYVILVPILWSSLS